jgi:hypothetical protein
MFSSRILALHVFDLGYTCGKYEKSNPKTLLRSDRTKRTQKMLKNVVVNVVDRYCGQMLGDKYC